MTIGALSEQTGVSVKILRTYEDLGLLSTLGRSPGNYRLFGQESTWCVAVVEELRSLGLTLVEIKELAEPYLGTEDALGPRMAAILKLARQRTEHRIEELRSRLERLDRFEARHLDELDGRGDFRAHDPCLHTKGLESPTGRRP